MDFQTVLLLTGGIYLFLLLGSKIPDPVNNKLYGMSHFGVIVITIFAFCVGFIRMCYDQRSVHEVSENTRGLSSVIKEVNQLDQELNRLDPTSSTDRMRLMEITKRLKEIQDSIEETKARLKRVR